MLFMNIYTWEPGQRDALIEKTYGERNRSQ